MNLLNNLVTVKPTVFYLGTVKTCRCIEALQSIKAADLFVLLQNSYSQCIQ